MQSRVPGSVSDLSSLSRSHARLSALGFPTVYASKLGERGS